MLPQRGERADASLNRALPSDWTRSFSTGERGGRILVGCRPAISGTERTIPTFNSDETGARRGGRRPAPVRKGEPGESYVTALRKWPDEIAKLSRADLAARIGIGQQSLSSVLQNGPRWQATELLLRQAVKIIKACGGEKEDRIRWTRYHHQVAACQAAGEAPPPPPEPFTRAADRTTAATPGALLRADVECVAFYGRSDELDALARWRDTPEPFAMRLVTGEGGQGKTRLALEFLRRSRDREGWCVEWVGAAANPHKGGDGMDEQFRERLHHGTEPVLVVVDYAESDPAFVSDVVAVTLGSPNRTTRLLLLSRTVAAWWENFRDWPMLAGLTTHTRLGPHAASFDGRRESFEAVVEAMADGLSTLSRGHGSALPSGIDWSALVRTVTVPDLRHDRYENALNLHMTALTMLLNAAAGESTDVAADPVQDVLRHERVYLHRVAARRGLNKHGVLSANPDDDSRIQDSVRARDRTIAALILLGACDRRTAESVGALACAGTDSGAAGYVADWLAVVYPAQGKHDGSLGYPQPDRLADAMLCLVLDQQPDLLERVVPLLDDLTRARHMLAVLARAAEPPAGSADVGLRLVELIRGRPTPFALVAPWVAAMTANAEQLVDGMCALADADAEQFNKHARFAALLVQEQQPPLAAAGCRFLVELYRRLRAVRPGHHYHLAGLASSLNGLGVMLAATRRYTEALESAREAVDIYYQLVDRHGDIHRPDLVVAIANYAARLSETAQPDQAVVESRRALYEYDQLTERDRVTYSSHQAIALNNYVTSLAAAGKFHDALEPSRQVIAIQGGLVDNEDRDRLPQLAGAQSNYAVLLNTTGQVDAAVQASREAMETWGRLNPFDEPADLRVNPDLIRFLPAMAEALATHAALLTETGRADEALKFSQQALRISEELVSQIGNAYKPTWAFAMQNHAATLSATGDTDQATSLSRRTVATYEALTENNRATYLPRLAQALLHHAAQLDEAGDDVDAMKVSTKGIELWQELAVQNHDRYKPVLGLAVYQHASRLTHAETLAPAELYAGWSVEVLAEFADDTNFLLDYIRSLIQLGQIRVRARRFQAAIEPLTIALARSVDLSEFDRTDVTDLLRIAEQVMC